MPGIESCEPDAFLERFRKETCHRMWLGVVLGALIFQLAPLFVIGVPLPAQWLSVPTRDRYARALAGTRVYLVRQLVFLVKFVAGMCWGAHPEVRAKLGLPAYPADPNTWRTA